MKQALSTPQARLPVSPSLSSHIPSVFHDRVASCPRQLLPDGCETELFPLLEVGGHSAGGPPSRIWGSGVAGIVPGDQAQHVFPGTGGDWLTLEEAGGNSVSLRHAGCVVDRREGSPGQLSAISGLRFAVPSVGLDVMWLSQVLQSCELRNVCRQSGHSCLGSWCL